MPNPGNKQDRVLLDACTLINLYATGRFEEILDGLRLRFGIVEYVIQNEALFVVRPDSNPPSREAVDLTDLLGQGKLILVEISGESEAELFISLALRLDDGEARTLAVASNRGYGLATDDRKTRKLAESEFTTVNLYSTLEIVKLWAESNSVDEAVLREVLRNIRERANFFPGKQDPLLFWWRAHC